jgi:hypothetical protein
LRNVPYVLLWTGSSFFGNLMQHFQFLTDPGLKKGQNQYACLYMLYPCASFYNLVKLFSCLKHENYSWTSFFSPIMGDHYSSSIHLSFNQANSPIFIYKTKSLYTTIHFWSIIDIFKIA